MMMSNEEMELQVKRALLMQAREIEEENRAQRLADGVMLLAVLAVLAICFQIGVKLWL